MGYLYGNQEQDYPNLNKCPDCETFFEGLNCPLCGKECPEEFRAGIRKPLKIKKERNTGSGRVQFVPWYLSTWFIILMLFFQPIIGLILMWKGDWHKAAKIILTVLLILSFFGSFLFGGVIELIDQFLFREEIPINTDLSEEEYVARCEALKAETVYREAAAREGDYVVLTVEVERIRNDAYAYNSDYTTYYECSATEDGKTWRFLIRDFSQGKNLIEGDRIQVYGQILGNAVIYAGAGEISGPCIGMRYFEFVPELD